MSRYALSTDTVGEEVGSEHSEVGEMGKGGSVEDWEGACWHREEGACTGIGGEETSVESEAVKETGPSTIGETSDGAVLEHIGRRLVVDSVRVEEVA